MATFYDTLLWEYIKNPWRRGLSLDTLAENNFGYKTIHYDEITGKGKIHFKDVDLRVAADYSWEDVYVTSLIYEKQKQDGVIDNKILQDIEIPLLHVLKDMEMDGIKIDRDKLKGIGMQLEQAIASLQKEIIADAGQEFNISSPKQVGEILFEKMGIPPVKKTKTGYSVDSDVLEWLAKQYPIAQKIIEYRHYSKLLSTYVEGLLEQADEHDIAHTSYNQTVAATGRLSSTDPNLQNIPTGDGIAWEIRAAFIPYTPQDIIMAFDYSQVEIRILAIMSQDDNLCKAFEDDIDIHYNTARLIFGKDDISSTERKYAKTVNFGVIYGISPFGLSQMLDISRQDAKLYIDKFFENYPKVREFFDTLIKSCEEKGYVETLFGRRRIIGGINDANKMMKQAAEREAMNMPIQGTAADIIKLAMIEVAKFLKEKNLKSKMMMQVHDELVFNVVPGEKEILETEITRIMEGILIDSRVKLVVDSGSGKNWKEAK